MIARIWHGWTTPGNADAYQELLEQMIFPGIAAKAVRGYLGIELLRRPLGDSGEVEFLTLMRFDSLEAVREFAGADFETAYVPAEARELLARFDARSAHYEVLERHSYSPS